MKEQLIEFKTAKLAKEKGFDWECAMWNDGEQSTQYAGHRMDSTISNKTINEKLFYKRIPFSCTIPTQSLLQKWLREIYNLHTMIECDEGYYFCHIIDIIEDKTVLFLGRKDTFEISLEQGLYEALKLIT